MAFCFKPADVETDEPGSIIRPFGDMERFQIAQHALHTFVSPMVGCRYTVPTNAGVLKDVFERAIARTVLDHPLMQVGIGNMKAKKSQWLRIASIDMQVHVQWHDLNVDSTAPAEETVTEVERVLHEVVEPAFYSCFEEPEARPGWKVVILRPRDESPRWVELFLTFNHANFDGMSAKIFHDSLLKSLRTLSSKETQLPLRDHILTIPNITKSKMTPSQEKLIPFKVSPGFVISELWNEGRPQALVPAANKRVRAAWASPNTGVIPSEFTKTNWRAFYLDATTLSRILVACRAHQATLTSLLQALLLASMCARVDATRAAAFKSVTAITLRRFAKDAAAVAGLDPDRTMANLVTTMPHTLDIDIVSKIRAAQSARSNEGEGDRAAGLDKAVWDVATKVREEIKAKLDKGPKDEITGAMKFIDDWRTFFKDEVKKPRDPSWIVTNIGTIDPATSQADGGETQDNWSIERALFTQGAVYAGPAFMVKVVSVKDQTTAVAFTWEEGVVSEELINDVSHDVESQLNKIGSDGYAKLE